MSALGRKKMLVRVGGAVYSAKPADVRAWLARVVAGGAVDPIPGTAIGHLSVSASLDLDATEARGLMEEQGWGWESVAAQRSAGDASCTCGRDCLRCDLGAGGACVCIDACPTHNAGGAS